MGLKKTTKIRRKWSKKKKNWKPFLFVHAFSMIPLNCEAADLYNGRHSAGLAAVIFFNFSDVSVAGASAAARVPALRIPTHEGLQMFKVRCVSRAVDNFRKVALLLYLFECTSLWNAQKPTWLLLCGLFIYCDSFSFSVSCFDSWGARAPLGRLQGPVPCWTVKSGMLCWRLTHVVQSFLFRIPKYLWFLESRSAHLCSSGLPFE